MFTLHTATGNQVFVNGELLLTVEKAGDEYTPSEIAKILAATFNDPRTLPILGEHTSSLQRIKTLAWHDK